MIRSKIQELIHSNPRHFSQMIQSKTEWQIMKELGYDRIWDCGNLKFELILK